MTGEGVDGGVVTPGNDTDASVSDLHYTVVDSGTDTSVTPPYPAYVVVPDVFTTATWAASTATGEWISALPATRAANGVDAVYTYETTFTVPPGVDPTTVLVTGMWACDDTCSLNLNGCLVATNPAAQAWGTLVPFTIPKGSPFVEGSNTLDFAVNNSGGDETGLLVTALTCCVVP
jgi:hypothetical protein